MNNFNLTANDIATYFVKKGVSPLQLQKLLYYSQVWYLKKFDRRLFSDDIKAWVFGPVVTSIWSKFKVVRRNETIAPFDHFYPCPTLLPQVVNDHLDNVWSSYGHLTGSQLVDLTHSELPWKMSRIGLLDNQPSDNIIVLNSATIKDYNLDLNGQIPYITSAKTLGYFSS
ncbi:Panacea domain-containing protein [Sphingobacterium corticibacter]|nr:type II toxin-antitoxin system antitoxin SocA domain-containing protein [Sphingobacterium corticibacter]